MANDKMPKSCWITLKDVPMKVDFHFYAGWEANEFDPGGDDELWIQAVWIEDYDVYHLIGEKSLQEVEAEVFKVIDEGGVE